MNITKLLTTSANTVKTAASSQMRAKFLKAPEKTILELMPKYTDEFGRIVESYTVNNNKYMQTFITRKDGAQIIMIGHQGLTPDVVHYLDSNKHIRRTIIKDLNDTVYGKDDIYTFAFRNGKRGVLISKTPKTKEISYQA